MKITLHVEADSVDELENALMRLTGNIGEDPFFANQDPNPNNSTSATTVQAATAENGSPEPAKRTRTRSPKKTETAATEGTAAATTAEPVIDGYSDAAFDTTGGAETVIMDDSTTTEDLPLSDVPDFLKDEATPAVVAEVATTPTASADAGPTDGELQGLMTEVIETVSFDAVKAILKKHGVQRVTAAGNDTAKRKAIYASLQAALL